MGNSRSTYSMPPPTTQNMTQTVQLPQWVSDAGQSNYNAAVDLSKTPFTPYAGQMVAGQTEAEKASVPLLQQTMSGATDAYGQALGTAQGVANFDPMMVSAPQGPTNVGPITGPANVSANNVSAQGFLDRDVNAYMNPFTESVIGSTMSDMERAEARGRNTMADNARSFGASGGSREAVERAVFGAENARGRASVAAGLRQAAFTDAGARMAQDNATALQAALANQSAGLTAAQSNQAAGVTTNAQNLAASQGNQQAGLTYGGQVLNAALANQGAGISGANVRLAGGQLAGTIGQSIGQTGYQGSLLSSQLGAAERGVNQAGLDANYNEFMRAQAYPQEMMNMRIAALGNTPYSKTTTGTSTSQAPVQNNSSNPWLTAAGVGMTALPLIFSDPKVKKNVKKLGKIPGTELDAHKFEYKKGFMGRELGPQVGLMADQVKRKVPSAVHRVKVGDKKVDAVDYPAALAGARSDKGGRRGPYRPRIGIGSRMRF